MKPATALLLGLGVCGVAGCPRGVPPEGQASAARTPALARARPVDAGAAAPAPPASSPAPLPPPFWADGPRRAHGTDVCDPARDTVAQAEREILAAPHDGPASVAAPARKQPLYLDRVDERFALTPADKRLLSVNGFVVPARLETDGYADALHEVYQSQLPIYVSADAIFHAVFRSHEAVVGALELDLATRERHFLDASHAALAKAGLPAAVASDLDVYLTVARSLLADATVPSVLGTDAEAAPLIAAARAGTAPLAVVTLFGRARVIDFSAFAPRGYYATAFQGALKPYFRASMWLSRLEFNLVSRGGRSSQPGALPDRDETPREAVDALGLARLAERAGVLDDVDALDRAWTAIAGKREDVGLRDLGALAKRSRIGALTVPASADALRAAIGAGYVRTARVHYMPQGSWPLPVIATVLGPRITPDTPILTHLVHADVARRDTPHLADLAFVLGSDRAKRYLAADLAAFPALAPALAKARADLAPAPGMFGAWFAAIGHLADEPKGQVPTYMHRDAFRDLRLSSIAAAYGQLRHGAVLMAGQAYSEGGCEIPDGFVDPVPAVYDALGEYARRGRALAVALHEAAAQTHFDDVARVMRVLSTIAHDEIAGRALSGAEKRWLSMVVEIVPPSSDGPGSYNGWYFDLFPDIGSAFEESAFVADWFTGSNTATAMLVGATRPRLGLFRVDVGGPARIMVGPVARGFEATTPLAKRAADLASLSPAEPWARSYTAPAPREPALAVLSLDPADGDGNPRKQRFAIRSAGRRAVRIDLLDHHRVVVGSSTRVVGAGWTVVTVAARDYPERVRVVAGPFSSELSTFNGPINAAFGGLHAVQEDRVYALRERLGSAPGRHQ